MKGQYHQNPNRGPPQPRTKVFKFAHIDESVYILNMAVEAFFA